MCCLLKYCLGVLFALLSNCRLIRFCDEDCVLKGVQIRKNSLVFLAADAIHHDPNVWTDPEVFNPER